MLKDNGHFLAEIAFQSYVIPDEIVWEGRVFNRTSIHNRNDMAAGISKILEPAQVLVTRKTTDINYHEYLQNYKN